MSENKVLRIKFELDNQSFQAVKTAIQSLTSELGKLSQAGGGLLGGGLMGGVNVGGRAPSKEQTVAAGQAKNASGGAQQTMGKVILDNASAFKKFAQEGKDASRIMTEALKRDIGEQEKALTSFKDKLSSLNDKYKEGIARQKEYLAAGNSNAADMVGKRLRNIEGQIAGTSGQVLKGNAALEGSQAAIANAGGGGFMSKMGMSGSGFGGGAAGMAGGIATLAGGIATAAVMGARQYQAWQQHDNDVAADRGGFVAQKIGRLRSMDTSDYMLRKFITNDQNANGLLNGRNAQIGTVAQGLGWFDAITGTVGDAAKTVVNGATLGLSGGITGPAKGPIGSRLSGQSRDQALVEQEQAFEDQARRSAEFQRQEFGRKYYTDNLDSRLTVRRHMGIGLNGAQTKTVNGKTVVTKQAEDTYGDLDVALTRQSRDINVYDGIRTALLAQGGRTFSNYAVSGQYAAQEGGYGGYSSALKGLAQSLGGDLKGASGLLGTAVGTSGQYRMDTTAGIQLAGAFGGYDPRLGVVDPTNLLNGFMRGVGGSGNSVKDMMNVESAVGGVAFGDKFTTGSLDSYQLGKNTVLAAKILGPGADPHAIDRLASQKFGQLFDRPTEDERNFGITDSSKGAYRTEAMNRVMDDFYSEKPNSGPGKAVLRYHQSGMNLEDYLNKNPGEQSMLKSALNAGPGGWSETDTSGSLLDIIRGTRSTRGIEAGGIGGAKLGEHEKAVAGAKADLKEKDKAELVKQEADLKESFKTLSQQEEVFLNWGTNMNKSVHDLMGALDNLTKYINRTAKVQDDGYGVAKKATPKGPQDVRGHEQ